MENGEVSRWLIIHHALLNPGCFVTLARMITTGIWLADATATAPTTDLPVGQILMGLAGGLALFLIGMDIMTAALKAAAGDRLRDLLGRVTRNPFLGVVSGTVVTGIIQSSSVTTVLLVGFLAAGLMTLPQAIGVILGANIGTTVTAQVIAFKVTDWALLMIAAGYAGSFVKKWPTFSEAMRGLAGIGIVFLGMDLMSTGVYPLRAYPPFMEYMETLNNPWLALLVGAIFTAAVQSSSVTTGIVIVMAAEGLMPLPVGIAVALGANVGTCVTAMLAAIGKPVEAVRVAVAHTLFNVVGALAWVFFVEQLADLAAWMSPASDAADEMARRAAETPRQIANAHTIFNVANTLVAVWFVGPFAMLVERLVPARKAKRPRLIQPRYIDDGLLTAPPLALDAARKEVVRLGIVTRRFTRRMLPAVLAGDAAALDRIEAGDDAIDALHAPLATYLSRIGQSPLSEDQTDEAQRLLEVANAFEAIGDIIETNLVTLARERSATGVEVSDETAAIIESLHEQVLRALSRSIRAVKNDSPDLARQVVSMKPQINEAVEQAGLHQQQRLLADAPHRLAAYTFEMDVIENLKRIYYFAKRAARTVLPDEAERRAAVEA